MKRTIKHLAIAAASMAVAAQTASAAFTFTNGDVFIGFQATGGIGGSVNVYYNLGSGTALRDGATSGVIGNVSTVLQNVYGDTANGINWFDRTDLYFGAIGNLNTGIPQGQAGAGTKVAAVDGDPSRTFYVTRATSIPGGSTGFTGVSSSSLGTAGGKVTDTETFLGSGSITSINDQTATFDRTGASAFDLAASWTTNNGFQNGGQTAGYGLFSGGIQTALSGNPETFLDLQRIITNSTGANPNQALNQGFTVASISLGTNGDISVIPEPTTGILAGIAGMALAFRRRRNP